MRTSSATRSLDLVGENGLKTNSKPTHMRVTSIQSMTTNASLDEGGAGAECSEGEESDTSPRAEALQALFDYSLCDSTPITVRNTFVEVDIPRPQAWEGCFEDRGVQSAPGSVLVFPPLEDDSIPSWIEHNQVYSSCEEGDEDNGEIGGLDSMFGTHSQMALISARPLFFQTSPVLTPVMQRWPASTRPMPVTLRLAEALEPAFGSAALPTIGSAGHNYRKCKPCAFAWKESGCESGASCKFCHLCDPTEKKRRRKAKLQVRRDRTEQKTGM